MNLLETLKEFKKIQPDSDFSENSRRAILACTLNERLSPRRFFARSLAVAGSLVMAGALIFIIAGGLSATDLAPQFSSIDPAALRAEAQAIDTQISLLNVDYTEIASTEPVAIGSKKLNQFVTIKSASSSMAIGAASSTPTSTMSVDEILQGLSQ
jgi:hypothetical protein